MHGAALCFALLAFTASVQDKTAAPVGDIIECVQKRTCKDATPSTNFPMRMTPEQTAQKRELRKAYRSSEKVSQLTVGTWGEQHKSFWQEQANAAVAAIRRLMKPTAG